jgi:hypothetical protein
MSGQGQTPGSTAPITDPSAPGYAAYIINSFSTAVLNATPQERARLERELQENLARAAVYDASVRQVLETMGIVTQAEKDRITALSQAMSGAAQTAQRSDGAAFDAATAVAQNASNTRLSIRSMFYTAQSAIVGSLGGIVAGVARFFGADAFADRIERLANRVADRADQMITASVGDLEGRQGQSTPRDYQRQITGVYDNAIDRFRQNGGAMDGIVSAIRGAGASVSGFRPPSVSADAAGIAPAAPSERRASDNSSPGRDGKFTLAEVGDWLGTQGIRGATAGLVVAAMTSVAGMGGDTSAIERGAEAGVAQSRIATIQGLTPQQAQALQARMAEEYAPRVS